MYNARKLSCSLISGANRRRRRRGGKESDPVGRYGPRSNLDRLVNVSAQLKTEKILSGPYRPFSKSSKKVLAGCNLLLGGATLRS
jgi:hypothetical protein